MKFYDQSGNEIEVNEFIEVYSKSYYTNEKRIVKGVTQSSRFVEEKIEKILKNGIKSKEDVILILAWKIGKIKHTESEKTKTVKPTIDWENAFNDYKVTVYGHDTNVGEFASYIVKHIKRLETDAESNPQGVLIELKMKSPDYIGSVYLITLLYFISKGKYPIYDRFACIALDAIAEETQLSGHIEYKELPQKDSKAFESVYEERMIPYIEKLKEVTENSGYAYETNRDVDRALWVYGHCFNKTDKVSSC